MVQYASQPQMSNIWPQSRPTGRQSYAMQGLTQCVTAQSQTPVALHTPVYSMRDSPFFSCQLEITYYEPDPQYYDTPPQLAPISSPSHSQDLSTRQLSANDVHIHAGRITYIIRKPMTEAEDDALESFVLEEMGTLNPEFKQQPQTVRLYYATRNDVSLASPPHTRPGTPRFQASVDNEVERED
jgi:hypothetical protein